MALPQAIYLSLTRTFQVRFFGSDLSGPTPHQTLSDFIVEFNQRKSHCWNSYHQKINPPLYSSLLRIARLSFWSRAGQLSPPLCRFCYISGGKEKKRCYAVLFISLHISYFPKQGRATRWLLLVSQRLQVDRGYTPTGEKCMQVGKKVTKTGFSGICCD